MNERERISKIIESEQMTARQFAQEIGVSAGTISNILGGRNNASLEIMTRILNRFRTISSDWLILGTGSMYRPNGGVTQVELFGDMRPNTPEATNSQRAEQLSDTKEKSPQIEDKSSFLGRQRDLASGKQKELSCRQVQRIIVFYTDGTFEER